MNRYAPYLLSALCLGALGACGSVLPSLRAPTQPAAAVMTPDADTVRPEPRGGEALGATAPRTADALDRTTPEERAAATVPAAGGALLGETLAALGSPAEAGFWLRTGLVTSPRQGRVEAPGGASVRLELRPSGNEPGAGSQMSLAAFRALGVSLTELVRLQVYAE